MAYHIDGKMIMDDLHKAYSILSPQSKNFLHILTMNGNGITVDQFKILNEMHDEVLRAYDATE